MWVFRLNFAKGIQTIRCRYALSNEQLDIEVTPAGPDQVYFWIVNEGKSRVPLNEHALAQVGEDFYLEISRPGYKSKIIEIPWGQKLDQNFTVEPQPVSIGVEVFDGEKNSIATQLADYLSRNPRFSITNPGTLEERKDKIAEEKAFIEENPMIQEAIRTSLGVDLIISGLYERH